MKGIRICLCFVLAVACLLPQQAAATERNAPYPVPFEVFEGWTEAESVVSLTGDLGCKASLLMEAATGKVLYASNEKARLPIASVTKIMCTLLLTEALDSGKITLDEPVTVSAYAASMGGSQVYLEPGEQMSVREMLKCLIVVSANDAAVALAEHICGSAEAFTAAMNKRAAELGMTDTEFANATGLGDEGFSSALDVALMTRELLKHPVIFDYTTIWMDTVRNGAFGLTNTNRLVRFYKGTNGMKTGFTSKAAYCVSATAKRNDMQLIAVVLGAPTSDGRFAAAKKMLDFGFANYRTVTPDLPQLGELAVKGGTEKSVGLKAQAPTLLIEKGVGEPKCEALLPEALSPPVTEGQKVGEILVKQDETELCRIPVRAAFSVKPMTFAEMFRHIWKKILSFV